MKKRIIALLLASVTVILAFSSCSDPADPATTSAEQTSEYIQTVETEEPASTEKQDETTATDVTTEAATTAEVTTTAATTSAITTSKPAATTSSPETTAKPVETTAVAEETTAAKQLTNAEKFRYDNFAEGKLSKELLDSVNPGVLALLSECMYFESELQAGIARGEKWVYSNSSTYVPQSGTFDAMVKSGKFGGNCSMPQAWFFVDMGIISSSHVYGNSEGEIARWSTYGKNLGAISTVYKWGGTKKFSELFSSANVKAGDIFYCKGHTFIYLGDDKFMAAGHDGYWHTDSTANTEDSKKAVFDSWIKSRTSCSDNNYVIYYQLRLDDDYMPRYYRNAAGKLVANPMYNSSLNIEYKTGDVEQTSFVDKTQTVKVYDTSGKTNVLSGLSTTAAKCVNIEKFSTIANMTDGNLYYDNTSSTYTDVKISGGNSYVTAPTYWFDVNGNQSTVKDETHKYLCAIKYELASTCTMNSFSVYTQAVGASTGTPFGDIDGFDILVSQDGVNWTVAYSVENAQCEYKWTDVTDASNKSTQGYAMCHYIRADFTQEVEGKYVAFALTQPRTAVPATAGKTQYSCNSGSSHYFRISELQVYKK